MEKIAQQFQTIDVAIHNACRCTFASLEHTDFSTYKDILDVNYFGALRLTKNVLPYMVNQHKGRMIYSSSGVGVTGFKNISQYASSKGAIESLAKCLTVEYFDQDITFHLASFRFLEAS